MSELDDLLARAGSIDTDDWMTHIAQMDDRWPVYLAVYKLNAGLNYAFARREIAEGRLTIAFNGPRKSGVGEP